MPEAMKWVKIPLGRHAISTATHVISTIVALATTRAFANGMFSLIKIYFIAEISLTLSTL